MYAIIAFLVLNIIVIIHEYGHLLAARLCGKQVRTFSVGLGTRLLAITDRHGTEWRLSAIPLGGYVSFQDEQMMANAAPLHRIIIAIAGPLANILAFVVITIVWGVVIGGDLIIGIKLVGMIGIEVLNNLHFIGSKIVDAFSFSPPTEDGLRGVIGMTTTPEFIQQDIAVHNSRVWFKIIFFTFISFNIGVAVFNLLPIPPLDGGHVLIAILELMIGKKYSNTMAPYLQVTGTAFVIALLVAITIKDVLRLVL